jgi:hypothetical protein
MTFLEDEQNTENLYYNLPSITHMVTSHLLMYGRSFMLCVPCTPFLLPVEEKHAKKETRKTNAQPYYSSVHLSPFL